MVRRNCGLVLLTMWLICGCSAPKAPYEPALDPANAKVDLSKIHPVTRGMQSEAGEFAGKPLPPFSLASSSGATLTNKDLQGKPSLLYFINLECPCCVDSNPIFRQIAQRMKQVRVLGVADGNLAQVQKWAQANEPGYEVLADPDQKLMRAMKIRNGVYFAVIQPNGQIKSIEPGVSQEVMQKLVTDLGDPFTIKGVPERLTSGCAFSWAE